MNVDGHEFRTKADYEAALRDKKKIQTIKNRVNFSDKEQVANLMEQISNGSCHFETVIGREFDDEVFEIYERIKNSKSVPNGKNNVTGKGQGKAKKHKKQKFSLEDCDEELKEQILLEIKKTERRRKLIASLCTLTAICSLGYAFLYYYNTDKTTKKSETLSNLKDTTTSELSLQVKGETKEVVEREILEEYKKIYNLNKKLIGWIKIDDTIIDYPVMQTNNNEYYLDYNFEQEKDKNGSIFMDTACDASDRSMNLILYGHNMKSGKMFGSLKNYKKESYYQKHQIIQFDTIYEKGTYQVMYVFESPVYSEEDITFKYYQFIDAVSEEEFYSNMKEMEKMSFYDTGVTAEYGEDLLTLSTCDSSEPNGRFVVVAKRIK